MSSGNYWKKRKKRQEEKYQKQTKEHLEIWTGSSIKARPHGDDPKDDKTVGCLKIIVVIGSFAVFVLFASVGESVGGETGVYVGICIGSIVALLLGLLGVHWLDGG